MSALKLREAAAILAEAVRNRSYREGQLGGDVARYLRYMRSSFGASPRTLEDYEHYLARLAAEHAHVELSAFEGGQGSELQVEFVDRNWGSAASGTRRKVLAILSSFFKWAVEMNRLDSNPVARIPGRASAASSATPTIPSASSGSSPLSPSSAIESRSACSLA